MNQALASGLCNFGAGGTVTCGKGAAARRRATAIGDGASCAGKTPRPLDEVLWRVLRVQWQLALVPGRWPTQRPLLVTTL